MQSRRTLLAMAALTTSALAATAMLTACATSSAPSPSYAERPPIVFVHGNGDSAALWQTTVWRFESNGWPADRLFAFDQPNPLARDDDAVAQPGRSSTANRPCSSRPRSTRC
jgi:triacylglycerol lipase